MSAHATNTNGQAEPSLAKTIYTGRAASDAVRVGRVRSDDGLLDVGYVPPVGTWDSEGTNPEQLFAAGWAICFHGLLGVAARDLGVDVSSSRVSVAVHLGEFADGKFGLGAEIEVSVDGVDDDVVHELVTATNELCPFSRATSGNIAATINGRPR